MKKRIIAFILGLTMALTMLGAFAAVSGSATSKINVRTAPSTTAKVAKKLVKGAEVSVSRKIEKGQTVTVSGKEYTAAIDWYVLATGGYVAAEYIELDGELDQAPAQIPESTPEDGGVSGEILDLGDGLLDVGGDAGAQAADQTEDVTQDALETGPVKLVASSTVNKRSGPGTGFTKVSRVLKGEKVTVTAIIQEGQTYNGKTVVGNWYKIDVGGYVSTEFFTFENAHSLTEIEIGDGVITTSSVNLRSGPGTDFDKVRTMSLGEKGIVTDIITDGQTFEGQTVSGDWALLQNGSYVNMDYLNYDETATIAAKLLGEI